MPVVPYCFGRPAQTWIAAMSGPGNGRELSAATSPARETSLAGPATRRADRPAKDTGGRQSPQPRRKRQRLRGLGKSLVRAQNGYTRGLPPCHLATLRDRRKPAEQTWRAPTTLA